MNATQQRSREAMAPSGTAVSTIGVAVAIPEPYGEQLRTWRASFGDRQAELIPTHITLLPPTDVPQRARTGVTSHLRQVAASTTRFNVHLRGTATFRPTSPVVFVQLVTGISECEQLERAVRAGPLQRDLAFYYHPHVTVAHDLPEDRLEHAFRSLADFECQFDVTEFHLYEHGADGVWRPAAGFGFGCKSGS